MNISCDPATYPCADLSQWAADCGVTTHNNNNNNTNNNTNTNTNTNNNTNTNTNTNTNKTVLSNNTNTNKTVLSNSSVSTPIWWCPFNPIGLRRVHHEHLRPSNPEDLLGLDPPGATGSCLVPVKLR